MIKYLFVILISYLVGSSSMSFYLVKLTKTELRDKGSKNLGASNAMMVMGWKYGILVAVHDIGKAFLVVLLATHLFPNLPYIGFAAGVASVLGHIFPFYLKFKGGKGFASYIGMTLALNWKFALILMVLVLIVTLVTDYIVIGTTLTVITVPIYYAITTLNWIIPAILCVATFVILYKHRPNYVRIINGTEMRLRNAHRGEYRKR